MAVNQSRSRNQGLDRGATEGSYKEIAPDREATEPQSARYDLDAEQYGNLNEVPVPLRRVPTRP